MSGELLLDLRHTGVCYRRRRLFGASESHWALEDVSLKLHKGETLGIIGRNGSGKTTLLRLLADIIRPDRGEIIRRPASYVILSLRLGFLEQLTARDNIIMSGMLFGLGKDEIEAQIPEILQFAELEDHADDPVATYSMGMSARLGFAIAMSADPDVMLIDEMLAVGDADFRKRSSAVLRERMLSNRTVVLVAHNEHAIRNLCSRVVWIENGRTVEQGEPDVVVANYREYLRKLAADREQHHE